MEVARVTSKGQVTVPKSVREALGVERGDLLVFVPRANGRIELRRLARRSLAELRGSLRTARSLPFTRERAAYRRAVVRRLRRGRAR